MTLSCIFSDFRCDADPSALAKYVIALAKKDKSECELRALCEDQLDVFLGDGIIFFYQLVMSFCTITALLNLVIFIS